MAVQEVKGRPIAQVSVGEGARVPALGLGTWRMGERAGERDREVRALKTGLDLGMTLIDTAEMYGEGGAEQVVAEAIEGRRDEVFLVSKVYPHNAGRRSAIDACERSLARLRTDRIDLYLLHWPGSIPLEQTVDAFERLRADGKILRWGVSNFDVDDIDRLIAVDGGDGCAANQVLYNLGERGIEWALLDRCRGLGMATMAYSPLGQGDLTRSRKLASIARRAGTDAATLALAWTLSRPHVIAIPKASSADHVRRNRAASDYVIEPAILAEIEAAFPPPRKATPLAMI